MLNLATLTFTCDHTGEEMRAPFDWFTWTPGKEGERPKLKPGIVCPSCGRYISLRHFEGRCMATRKLRREHEAKRDRPDRMRERGFRQDELAAAIGNPLVPTKQEKNQAKAKRRARR